MRKQERRAHSYLLAHPLRAGVVVLLWSTCEFTIGPRNVYLVPLILSATIVHCSQGRSAEVIRVDVGDADREGQGGEGSAAVKGTMTYGRHALL